MPCDGRHEGQAWACVIDNEPINTATPLNSMFLHGGWAHLLGNCLFLWVFGNNVEDAWGAFVFSSLPDLRIRGSGKHVLSIRPHRSDRGRIGAIPVRWERTCCSTARSREAPHTDHHHSRIVKVRAWVVLGVWFVWQVMSGLPQLTQLRSEVSGGVAVWAHVGGFVTGMLLVHLFENPKLVERRTMVSDARGAFAPET